MSNVIIQRLFGAPPPPPDEGSPTLVGQLWTPQVDGSGFILPGEFNFQVNTWYEWDGTKCADYIQPLLDASGYVDPGASDFLDHFDGFTGNCIDQIGDWLYHFGGGHGGSANNCLTGFNLKKGTHHLVIPPTPQSMHPPGYSNYTVVDYSGTSGPANIAYFPSSGAGVVPMGDGKKAASHEYEGIAFDPVSGEVVMVRNGWFHANPTTGVWREGPQVAVGDRLVYSTRGGFGASAHYLPLTQKIYMNGALDTGGTSVFITYDPVSRTEIASCGFAGGGLYQSTFLAPDPLRSNNWTYWFLIDPLTDQSTKLHSVNVQTNTPTRANVPCTGRLPGWLDGGNPVQHVASLNKNLCWVTDSKVGGAQRGEMLDIDLNSPGDGGAILSLHAMTGTPPASPILGGGASNYFGKMKLWEGEGTRPDLMVLALGVNRNHWIFRPA